jgi:hypothetical protein
VLRSAHTVAYSLCYNLKQDRPCTENATSWRAGVTSVCTSSGYPNYPIPHNSKGELLWRFIVTGNSTYASLQVKCPLFLPDFNQIYIFSADFHVSILDIKFQENPSSGTRADTSRRQDRQTDMTKVEGRLKS